MSQEQGLRYLSGFGNEWASEAIPDSLPVGQNSPQHVPFGLYAEQLSGTAFTMPRSQMKRTWLYRIRPTAMHGAFRPIDRGTLQSPASTGPVDPNRLRWNPRPIPEDPTDFIEGLYTMGGNGDPSAGTGVGILLYAANRSMADRAFFNADGEMLLVPQQGALRIVTECGLLDVAPGEIAVLPRGMRFAVHLKDGAARGYICENYGTPFRLPDLGPIGSNGLANPRDFLAPVASYEDQDRPVEIVQKFMGHLWATDLPHSPFDVVAWHGNYAPYKYDLARFNTIGTVSFDHPDPSIFTVLTSPSEIPGMANVDFVIFPPRWMVAEHTFRPPWFHRNLMNEFMGLIHGAYDAKADGFSPGGASLHNCMSGHGPDLTSYQRAVAVDLAPHKIDHTLAFMFETRAVIRPTEQAMASPDRQSQYDACWAGFPNSFKKD